MTILERIVENYNRVEQLMLPYKLKMLIEEFCNEIVPQFAELSRFCFATLTRF